MQEEDRRTVLLVGVSRVNENLKKENSKLTELGLQKILQQTGYPIQAVKLLRWRVEG